MKTFSSFILVFSLLITVSFSQQKIKMPATTVVVVKTQNKLAGDQLKVGQEVVLIVATDVIVKGAKVIKAGSPVIGVVESAESAGMIGSGGKLTVSIQSTTAVDGTTIALSGNLFSKGESSTGEKVAVGVILCPLALLCKGEESELPAGFQTRALTMGEYEITVSE